PPSAPGGGLTAPPMEKTTAGIMEGSVKKVDPAAQTVQISTGLFGIMGRTLGVTEQTQIQTEGRQGTLADLREGNKVRAAYEAHAGTTVAPRIEVMPSPPPPPGATPPPSPSSGARVPAPGNPVPGSDSTLK